MNSYNFLCLCCDVLSEREIRSSPSISDPDARGRNLDEAHERKTSTFGGTINDVLRDFLQDSNTCGVLHIMGFFCENPVNNAEPRTQEDFAQSPSMARSKSSSSGLRLAFYPEHILWERELWSRLRNHIKQWLFVVNKARAACRGPSRSPSLYSPLTARIQSAYYNSGLSDKCFVVVSELVGPADPGQGFTNRSSKATLTSTPGLQDDVSPPWDRAGAGPPQQPRVPLPIYDTYEGRLHYRHFRNQVLRAALHSQLLQSRGPVRRSSSPCLPPVRLKLRLSARRVDEAQREQPGAHRKPD
ncbi:hypothetical protein INR49_010667 [Caranx melampygus]|nr:hypothetical protein INR49_010667 [Caranx melampygus]